MECTQILLSESCNDVDTVKEKCPVATLSIGGEYYTIYNTENVIGRDNGCDVIISNNAVSSKHAVIEAEDPDAHLIYDLGSTNKTKLGKMLLKPHVRYHINDGDYVTFGNVSAQYNILRQYPNTPDKGRTILNSCTVPETPERPELDQGIDDVGGIKVKIKPESSCLDSSDTDMFDEKESNSNRDKNNKPISLSKVNNDIYELDTLSFDENIENEVRQTLGSKHTNKSNVILSNDDFVESTSVTNLNLYDVSTQEPVSDVKHLPGDLSNFEKDKLKNNYGWEDFPEIASPVGLDTSNPDNLDCPKPKLSSSLLDTTSEDLKKNRDVSKSIEGGILSDLSASEQVESTVELPNKSQLLSSEESVLLKIAHESRATVNLEGLDFDKTPLSSKNNSSYDLKKEQYIENDIFVPLSQNVDMFEVSPEKVPGQDDVYEMLTQVDSGNGEINNPNESIYEIQTQLVVVNHESVLKVTNYPSKSNYNALSHNDSLSDVSESATQPLDAKVNDIKSTSFASVKVIDETDQDCSFSFSIYEAATQPHPHFCEEKLVSSLKEVSNEKLVKEVEIKDLADEKNSVLNRPYEVATQPILQILHKSKLKDQEAISKKLIGNMDSSSWQDKTVGNCSFSTSMYEAGTQPCHHISSQTSKDAGQKELKEKLTEIVNIISDKIQDENDSFSYETATQPYPQAKVENSHLKQKLFDNKIKKDEVSSLPCPQDAVEERIVEKEMHDLTKKRVTKLFPCQNELDQVDSFSTSMCEAATQPYLFEEKSEVFLRKVLTEEGPIDVSTPYKINKDKNDVMNPMYEVATQPYQKEMSVDKTEVKIDELSNKVGKNNVTSPKIIDETNNSFSFSVSQLEVATQPCSYGSENTLKQFESSRGDKTIKNLDVKETCVSEMSKSFFEAATQPAPVECHSNKDSDSKYEGSSNIITGGGKQDINSASINSEETECVLQLSRKVNDTFDKTELYDKFLDSGMVATQPLLEASNSSNSERNRKSSNPNLYETQTTQVSTDIEIEPNSDFRKNEKEDKLLGPPGSIYEADKQPLLHTETPKIETSKGRKEVKEYLNDLVVKQHKNVSCDNTLVNLSPEDHDSSKLIADVKRDSVENLNHTFSESFLEAATQPAPDQTESRLELIDENLTEQLITEITKPVFNNVAIIGKHKSVHQVLQKSDKHSFTTALPNTMSDSFFEEATQPCKSDHAEDGTFLCPLTSICSDLSVDKISKITDELMHGNLSTILADKNKTLNNNNQNEESYSKIQQNVDITDDNIYEVFNEVSLCSSHRKVSSSETNDEKSGKLSTQDLKRILESDDLMQKYDEFQQISVSNQFPKENHVLKNHGVLCNDEIQIIGAKETSPNDKKQTKTNHISSKKNGNEDLVRNSTNHQTNITLPISCELDSKNVVSASELSQEMDIRSNKKRCNIFPADSEDLTNNDLENGSSQELNIRCNIKHCNVFPPDTQDCVDNIGTENDDSEELIIRSNKKHCNVFPSDTQDCVDNIGTENDDSEEFIIRSNKKHCNVFPSDSQDFINKDSESERKISAEPFIKTNKTSCVLPLGSKSDSDIENIISNAFTSENIIEINIKKLSSDDDSANVDIVSIKNYHHSNIKEGELVNLNNCKKSIRSSKQQAPKGLKGKCAEKNSTSLKRNSKDSKNKSPPEREPTYISRGNITFHSPEVLSELEEQFRLTKVAMSPTQLYVMSDLDSDINSSQEVIVTPAKQDVRQSVRSKKTASVKKVSKSTKQAKSQDLDPPSLAMNYKRSERSENKRKALNSASHKRSFKKFKKVSPMKNSPSINEKKKEATFNETSVGSLSVACIYSDNSQNSEELGRGKRKRVRTSYEGFILDDDIKRTPRKKLFSHSEDDGSLNTSAVKIEEVKNKEPDKSQDYQNNVNIKHTVSVVLHDIQKHSPDVAEFLDTIIDKSRTSKNKKTEHSSLNEGGCSHASTDKKSNIPNTFGNDCTSTKKCESSNKNNKNFSFSFTEKLDELFNIWGPADRVKLSPRVAKKSYKLLADGKIEGGSSWSSTTSGKKCVVGDFFSKETKHPKGSSSNKINNISSNEKKITPSSDKVTAHIDSDIYSRRNRVTLQKNEPYESYNNASQLNKRRKKTNSETSENSMEVDTENKSDSTIRKSSRISKKKHLEIMSKGPVSVDKSEQVPAQNNKTSKLVTEGRICSDQSVEKTVDATSNCSNNVTIESKIKNLSEPCIKAPPLNSIINMKKKNVRSNGQMKKKVHKEEPCSDFISEDGCCFSQEFSYHENKIEKERNFAFDNLPPPLPIRRSSRKKNEKNVEKTVEHVMFTGFADKKTKSLVNILGGQIVESPFTCTVLVTDKIRRTTKFLAALSRGLPIVSPQWLIDSKENGRFMDFNDFLLSDRETEAMFSFDLKKSIEKAHHSKLLDGWTVFVTPSVQPSPEEMKSIIECSGGRFLSKEPTRWPTNSLVVSCIEDQATWYRFSKRGKGPIVVENEAIFLGVLRQELNLKSHRLL